MTLRQLTDSKTNSQQIFIHLHLKVHQQNTYSTHAVVFELPGWHFWATSFFFDRHKLINFPLYSDPLWDLPMIVWTTHVGASLSRSCGFLATLTPSNRPPCISFILHPHYQRHYSPLSHILAFHRTSIYPACSIAFAHNLSFTLSQYLSSSLCILSVLFPPFSGPLRPRRLCLCVR